MKTKTFITKTLIAICLCFSFSIISNAQKATFGVKAGFNASSLSGIEGMLNALNELGTTNSISTSYKPGFHAGLISQVNFSQHFFVQPELLFSMQGIKAEGTIFGTGENSESDNLTLSYLQLPIYAGYKIDAGSGLKVILGAGPYVGYGISGSDHVFDDESVFQRFDFGLSAMGGVQFERIQLTVGYDLGLVDLVGAPGWDTAKDLLGLSAVSNRNIKISLAYLF